MQHTVTTHSPEETERFGLAIGQNMLGGEVVELISDLGGGKTTFTHGLVAGLASPDTVMSPTFTVSREYSGGRLHVYHFDFYRLPDPGIIANQVSEVAQDPDAVVVVEWADVVHKVLPKDRIIIRIVTLGNFDRTLTVEYPETMSYAVKDIL